MSNVFHRMKKLKKKKIQIIASMDAEKKEKKNIWQNPTSIHDKNSQQIKNRKKLPEPE